MALEQGEGGGVDWGPANGKEHGIVRNLRPPPAYPLLSLSLAPSHSYPLSFSNSHFSPSSPPYLSRRSRSRPYSSPLRPSRVSFSEPGSRLCRPAALPLFPPLPSVRRRRRRRIARDRGSSSLSYPVPIGHRPDLIVRRRRLVGG